jgi:serine/threonine protein phosphatase 1
MNINGPVVFIGDIHGYVESLKALLEKLDITDRWVVFLGDLVDKAGNPKETIETVIQLMNRHPKTVMLAGNHDLSFARAIGVAPAPDNYWKGRYCRARYSRVTFHSYGASHGDLSTLTKKVPLEHKNLLENMPWCVEHDEILGVHAGLVPNNLLSVAEGIPDDITLEDQLRMLRERDFSLQRPPWLHLQALSHTDVDEYPKYVISGHNTTSEVKMVGKHIHADTGVNYGGKLSAVLYPELEVLSVPPIKQSPFLV